MIIRLLAVCLFTVCSFLGCTQPAREATAERESLVQDTQAPTPVASEIEPQLSLGEAIPSSGTCHAPVTCGPEYSRCNPWSVLSYCDDTCTKRCCHDAQCNEPDMSGTVFRQQVRQCLNNANQSCFEWRVLSEFVCGC